MWAADLPRNQEIICRWLSNPLLLLMFVSVNLSPEPVSPESKANGFRV